MVALVRAGAHHLPSVAGEGAEAHDLPQKRAKTRLNRVGKVERLAGKKIRGTIKAERG